MPAASRAPGGDRHVPVTSRMRRSTAVPIETIWRTAPAAGYSSCCRSRSSEQF